MWLAMGETHGDPIATRLNVINHGCNPWKPTMNDGYQPCEGFNVINCIICNVVQPHSGLSISLLLIPMGSTHGYSNWNPLGFLNCNTSLPILPIKMLSPLQVWSFQQNYNIYFSSNSIPCSFNKSINSSLEVAFLWCSSWFFTYSIKRSLSLNE